MGFRLFTGAIVIAMGTIMTVPTLAQNLQGPSHRGQILRADDMRNDRISPPPVDTQTGSPNYQQAMGFGQRSGGHNGRSLYSHLADLQSSTRDTFLKAQAYRDRGEDEAACKTLRKAIEKDRRYMASKKKLYPETEMPDESSYQGLEAEYCGSERS
ncbi:hypothetical protein [Asticcacaulis excentricus]|uniref:Uncharacterized protein n=1 Tax=Asticcacaulis excentricus (strain ATCC 15261 / DSM 4724 / KCTC 12464 / NCIMB 9791 / VKM B-1370 / CB 48) TaxID=573065 RepID=E8RKH9_ASTEC|nr:hypothetical protein [Asticcacaulis excentricus]ADU12459.1 hypothetical protein Astex_0774 [Asticcacaulis excentricus CB 48]